MLIPPYPQNYAPLITGQHWVAQKIQCWAKFRNVRPPATHSQYSLSIDYPALLRDQQPVTAIYPALQHLVAY